MSDISLLSLRSMRHPPTTLTVPQRYLALGLWLAVMPFAIYLGWRAGLGVDLPTLLFFALLHTFSVFFGVRLPLGARLGLDSLTLIAGALVLGHERMSVIGLGVPVFVALIYLPMLPVSGLPRQSGFAITFETIWSGIPPTLALMAIGWLLDRFADPASSIPALRPGALYLGFVTLYTLINAGFMGLWVRLGGGSTGHAVYWRRYWLLVLVTVYLPPFFTPLLTHIYLAFPTFWPLILLAHLTITALVYSISRVGLSLTQRLADLHALNIIGQALVSELKTESLLMTIYRELSRLIDTSNFYLALYDAQSNLISFPLMFRNGQRVDFPPRPFANGLTEYVIRTRRPLLIECDALAYARQKLGLEPVGDEASFDSFLAVPILFGESVLGVMALRAHSGQPIYTRDDVQLLQTIAAQAGVALRNAQLYERTHTQSNRLATLNRISSLLSAGTHLETALETICMVVAEVVNADKVAIFLLDENGQTARLAASVGLSTHFREKSALLHLEQDKVRTEAMHTGQMIITDDAQAERYEDVFAELVCIEGFRTVVDVPLRIGARVTGVLSVYYNQPRHLDPQDVELLQTVGGQIATAVESTHLFEVMREHNRELETLYEASAAISSSLSLEHILQAVSTSLIRALEAQSCVACLGLDDVDTLRAIQRVLTVEGGAVDKDTAFNPIQFSLADLPAIAKAIRHQQPLPLSLVSSDLSQAERDWMQHLGLTAGLALPLVPYEGPPGLIVIGLPDDKRSLKPESIRLAEALVNQAAVAVENARLFERTDVALARRLDEIAALELISQRMTRELDLQGVLEQVVHAASLAVGADVVEVALLDEKADVLRALARRGPPSWEPQSEWPAESGIVGLALRTGRPVIVEEVSEHPAYVATAPDIRSELAVPIMLEGKRLGVINLESTRPAAFNADHLRFVTNLAEHAAIAIQNARLFEDVQRRAEELNALRQVAVELLAAPDVKHILRLIVQSVSSLTQATNVHIYHYDQGTDRLTFEASRLDTGEFDRELSPPRPDGLTATVARTGQKVVVTDPATHPLFAHMVDEWGADFQIVGIPLKRGDEVIGVFNAAYDLTTRLDEAKLGFLDLLAAQASVALVNARLAEQTRAVRDRLQAIVDSSHDGILMFDNDARLVIANPRAEYLLNLRLRDYIGQHYLSILAKLTAAVGTDHPAYSRDEVHSLVQSFENNPSVITRRRYTIEQPALRAIEELSTAVIGDRGERLGRLVILRDITQEYEMEAYRQEMSQMIIHDLRSPIGSVITGLHLALDELNDNPDSPDLAMLKTSLEMTMQSADMLLRLVEAILDVNKLEAGEVTLELTPLDLREVTERAYRTLEGLASEANIAVLIEAPDDLPPILADSAKIERVLLNLLDNALRYTPRGGHVLIRITPGETHYTLAVIDNGPGIPPEYRERIFERFVQVDANRRQRGSKGSGLGLTFCALAVEAHGGRIWVEDAPGSGAAFYFTLPVPPQAD